MKEDMGRVICRYIKGITSFAILFAVTLSSPAFVYAVDEWIKEFEAVCSQTGDAMDLTKDQLKELVDRCDRLKPVIQQQNEIQRKVYLKRLDNCCDFYKFVLESKNK
jgi:hypothetical protein